MAHSIRVLPANKERTAWIGSVETKGYGMGRSLFKTEPTADRTKAYAAAVEWRTANSAKNAAARADKSKAHMTCQCCGRKHQANTGNGSLIGKPTAPTIKPPMSRRCHWLTGSDGLTMTLHIGGKRLGHVKRADGKGWQWHCGLPGIARNDMHGKTDELPEARAAVECVCLKWFEDVDREIVS